MYVEDENINSGANFKSLRKEALLLSKNIDLKYCYPNLAILVQEEKASLLALPVEQIAFSHYRDNDKIGFIKFLRERFKDTENKTTVSGCIGLKESKMMADGYWADFKTRGL